VIRRPSLFVGLRLDLNAYGERRDLKPAALAQLFDNLRRYYRRAWHVPAAGVRARLKPASDRPKIAMARSRLW
jgi:hypothetical protein